MVLTTSTCRSILQPLLNSTALDSACSELVDVADEDPPFADFSTIQDYIDLGITIACVLTAAIAAGLTLGVVSLDHLDLRIKERSDNARERWYAKQLLPLITWRPRHQLLVTLLLLNTAANETLPVFLDRIVPPWAAILFSVTAILLVAEILPSAIFTGPAKLRLAAYLSWFIWLLMLVLSPVSYPLGWLLDCLIPENKTLKSRNEVRALVDVQRELCAERGVEGSEAFNKDEADLVRGALSLSTKCVVDVMVPIDDVYALPSSTILNEATMASLLARGHSRVPIHRGPDSSSCTSFLMLKDHLLLSPSDAVPVSNLFTHKPIWVGPDDSLFELLNSFQQGHAHMAFVSRDPDLARQAKHGAAAVDEGQEEWPSGRSRCIGIITLEDIIEEILTEEIYDESDLQHAERTLNEFVRTVIRPRLEHKRNPIVGADRFAPPSSPAPAGGNSSAADAEAGRLHRGTGSGILSRAGSQRVKVLRGRTLRSSGSCRHPVSASMSMTAPLLAAEHRSMSAPPSTTASASGASNPHANEEASGVAGITH